MTWPPRAAEIWLVRATTTDSSAIEATLADECAQQVTVVDRVEAAARLREALPDLLLLHGRLDAEACALLEAVQLEIPVADHVPVVIVTDGADPSARRLALDLGATDVLTEPIPAGELCRRVRNHLSTRLVVAALQHTADGLREQLEERDAELECRATEQLEHLRLAMVARDKEVSSRSERISTTAWMLALAAGTPMDFAERLRLAAPLHDVGNLGIPDAVLSKVTPLTARERRIVEHHTLVGARLLGASHAPLLALAASVALSHHERWDGDGYPFGIATDRIPLAARIVAVVDTFDAITHARPYQPSRSVGAAVDELQRVAGSQLDPDLVRAFVDEVVPALPDDYGDPHREGLKLVIGTDRNANGRHHAGQRA